MRVSHASDLHKKHSLTEVPTMGQLDKDWTQLKTIIRQKDDAIDRQAAQIAELQ